MFFLGECSFSDEKTIKWHERKGDSERLKIKNILTGINFKCEQLYVLKIYIKNGVNKKQKICDALIPFSVSFNSVISVERFSRRRRGIRFSILNIHIASCVIASKVKRLRWRLHKSQQRTSIVPLQNDSYHQNLDTLLLIQ